MQINQIYQLLNDTAAECFGSQAVSTLDIEDLVALRDTVFSAGSDLFLNTLVDRIGKTVLRTLDFTATFPKFLMEEYEYGCILQKINVDVMPAQEAQYANLGSVGFQPEVHMYKVDKPRVFQDFFHNGINAWEIDVTIPDTLYKSAFESAQAMAAFINGIFDTMSTSMNIQLENDTRIALLGFIGEKVNASNGVVDLLSLYNQVAATPITTADAAMCDKEFLRFAGKIMRNYIEYMKKPSVLYNMASRIRATRRDNMHVLMLTEFASATATYLESDTFHNELVKLPYYQEVEYWQGTGATAPNFADCSTIDIKIPSDGTAVQQAGIVAVFMDREAVGTGIFDRFSAADRSNRLRFTNYTEGATIQSFADTSENGVIFVVVDQTP